MPCRAEHDARSHNTKNLCARVQTSRRVGASANFSGEITCGRWLHVAGCVGVRDPGLRAVAARCATLQYVDVSGCPAVTRDGVRALRTGCRAIKKLVA